MENFSTLWRRYLNAVEHCGQGRAHRAAAHTVGDPYGVKDHSRMVMEKRSSAKSNPSRSRNSGSLRTIFRTCACARTG